MKLWGIFTVAVLMSLTSTACVGGWVEESSSTSKDLYAVFGVSSGDVFAVGAGGTVLRRQNAKWRELDSGTSEDLYGVWGTADDHVVVVGENCAALEYDGPVEPPEEGEPPPDLHALNVASCGNFRDLDGDLDNGNAFVVGERTASQWYGGGGLSNGRDFSERMQGVSMQVNDEIHACGDEGAYYRKHDGSWTLTSVTVCGVELVDGQCPEGHEASPILWDVWASAAGEGALVGSSGGVWRLPPPAEGGWESEYTDFDADLMAVSGYVDEKSGKATMFAAGNKGVLIRISPEKVIREAPGTHADLYGIWVSRDGSEVYAVGQAGTIVHLSR
jgi:hypothetical protein